jgi:phosphoglycolate phosphatase
MTPDALIFDLDGTLWNCTQATASAINLTYEKFSVKKRVDINFVKSITGKPASECYDIILKSIPSQDKEEALKYFDHHELDQVRQSAIKFLYEGVGEGLATLNSKFKLFIVSNCNTDYLSVFIKHSGIGHLFQDTECFGNTGYSKAENIKLLISRNNITYSCYIGDTASDEEAAYQAQVPFYHAAYGFGNPIRNPQAFLKFKELVDYFLIKNN